MLVVVKGEGFIDLLENRNVNLNNDKSVGK